MSVSHWQAYQALFQAIAKIRGPASGFWLDLGGRVFSRLIIPGEGDIALPYICLPLEELPAPQHGPTWMTSPLSINATMFVEESDHTGLEGSVTATLLQAYDDLLRAIFPEGGPPHMWNLGSRAVEDVRMGAPRFGGSMNDAISYGELTARFELQIRFAREDLGPWA